MEFLHFPRRAVVHPDTGDKTPCALSILYRVPWGDCNASWVVTPPSAREGIVLSCRGVFNQEKRGADGLGQRFEGVTLLLKELNFLQGLFSNNHAELQVEGYARGPFQLHSSKQLESDDVVRR